VNSFTQQPARAISMRPAQDFDSPGKTAAVTKPAGCRAWPLTGKNKKRTFGRLSQGEGQMDPDKRNAWLRKLDEECPYQVVLPRGQPSGDSEILEFLTMYVGKFDMYVEDEYATFVRYCFEDPLDAAIFRSRFEPKVERFKLVG
jgi:hypothetical protein